MFLELDFGRQERMDRLAADATGDQAAVKVAEIGLSISNHLLQRVRDLPGIMIAVKGRVDDMPPVRFRFDGGCGLIMPMRDQGKFE